MKSFFKILVLSIGIVQFNAQQFSGTNNTTADIFRSGRTAIGYSSTPSYGTNQRFLVNGITRLDNTSSLNQPRLLIGTGDLSINEPNINYWLRTQGGILVQPDHTWANGSNIMVRRIEPNIGGGFIQMAVAATDYGYSNNSLRGDLILRAHSWGGLSKNLIITNESNGEIKFSTKPLNFASNLVQMTITNEGNVGIGKENPTDKLEVNGIIHAKEVRVDVQGWPDYVFEKDYQLLTIEEVEKNIKEKGHLPNVPSATEIEANGLKLAEMNVKLMEKVEELTLYIIELNHRVKELESNLKKE